LRKHLLYWRGFIRAMDTRSKIVTREGAVSRVTGMKPVVLLSSFDVLTVERIRRVNQLGGDADLLIAVITQVPGSLLPAQARAELAASLAMVDMVVIDDGPLTDFPGARIIDDNEADQQRTTQLIESIQQRNRAPGE